MQEEGEKRGKERRERREKREEREDELGEERVVKNTETSNLKDFIW